MSGNFVVVVVVYVTFTFVVLKIALCLDCDSFELVPGVLIGFIFNC